MITPTSMEQILYIHRSNEVLNTSCPKSTSNTLPHKQPYPKRNRSSTLTHNQRYTTKSMELTTPNISTSSSSFSTSSTTSPSPSSSSSSLHSNINANIRSGSVSLSNEFSLNPVSQSDATSPTLKRRPSFSKRSQKSAHRIAVRRIISESHHHYQLRQQQQNDRSNASIPPSPSRHPLSLSAPSQLGAVTEAILQDELPYNLRPSGRPNDPSHSRSLSQFSLSPYRVTFRDHSHLSNFPSSPYRLSASPCVTEAICDNFPSLSTSSPQASQSFETYSEGQQMQGRVLCSNLSTAELQSLAPTCLISSQSLPSINRPKLRIHCKTTTTARAQAATNSAPPISRPWSSSNILLINDVNQPNYRKHFANKNKHKSQSQLDFMADSSHGSKWKQNSPGHLSADFSTSSSSFTTAPPILTPIHPFDNDVGHPLPTPLCTESKIDFSAPMQGNSTRRGVFFVDQSSDHQIHSHGSVAQQPQRQEQKNLVSVKGKPRRRSNRDLNSMQRRSSLRRPSCSKDNIEQRTSGLLKQRRPSQRYSRYFANKPLPYLNSSAKLNNLIFRDTQLEFNIADKPLPPIPSYENTPGKDFICDVMETHFSKEEVSSVIIDKEEISDHCNDIGIDHYYPLTDESMKNELMEIQQDMPQLLSTPPAKSELEPSNITTVTNAILPPLTAVSAISQLSEFKFPATSSHAINTAKVSSRKQSINKHNHHQSLPYNKAHSRTISRVAEDHTAPSSEVTKQSKNSSLASTHLLNYCGGPIKPSLAGSNSKSQCPIAVSHSEKIENQKSAMGKQSVGPERLIRHGSLKLKRSQSCNNKTHRPTLSLNSTKVVLLSLQDRRICKPNAKVHRLPDINTGATPTTANTTTNSPLLLNTSSTSGNAKESTVAESNFETSGNSEDIDDRSQETPQSTKNIDADVHMSSKEVEDETKLRATESYISHVSQSQGNVNKIEEPNDASVIQNGLTNDSRLQNSTSFGQFITQSEFGTALSSALNALTIDSQSEIDSSESKRFIKRSHALKELEATEESYVNDLDVLLHIYLRVLETKPWFPQIIHAKMCRCVNGLLSMHRSFHSRIEINTSNEIAAERYSALRVYRNLAESIKLLSLDNSLYSTFCELRMRTINEVNRSAGQTTMSLLQRESKELMIQQGRPSTRADLKDFLIKPIQRICRYPLLLKEILRLTNKDDPEYTYIDQCYQMMKYKAREMDENQRIVERRLLTEQFLKKLPDTIFPRKVGIISTKEQLSSSLVGDMSLVNNSNSNNNSNIGSSIHPFQTSQSSLNLVSGSMGPNFNPGFTSESHFDFGPSLEGIGPSPLTKAFVGTLGSIILAGAMEYVITPDVPVRLKYYGCFLFESMLIVVKAKKQSLYEPKQWLPLRLCELHEPSKNDGITRFGWTIIFDQFRIDFGANSAIEQQIWTQTLQERIKIAKESYARLPRDVSAFETVVSSLPWRGNNGFTAGYPPGRHQSPLHSPSPWSSCSSAIPSPLMPPPPSASSSTMMMAMSSMVTIEPERWNSRGSGQTLDAYAYRRESHQSDLQMEQKNSEKTKRLSTGGNENVRVGGMVSNWEPESTEQSQGQYQAGSLRPGLDQTRYELQPNGPSTPLPWPLQESSRTRNNSFDVTRVFTTSSNNIKPNQRTLVQSMFKDVSTEHVWTSTPTVSVISRHNSSNLLNYSQQLLAPSSPQVGGSGVFTSSFDPSGSAFFPEDNYIGMDSPSLTNRILRRRSSVVIGSRTLHGGGSGTMDKIEYERRRSSATAALAGTYSLNFRKNSDPSPTPYRQHRRSSSIIESGQYGTLSHERRGSDSNSKAPDHSNSPYSPIPTNRVTEGERQNMDINQPGGGNDMEALNSVAEAARSRRGNNDRVMKTPVKSLKTSSSSHSLPARLRTNNASAQSLLTSSLAEAPKDNVDRLWSAMGRMIPRRGGSNHEKPPRYGLTANNGSVNSQLGYPLQNTDITPSTSTSFYNQEQHFQSHQSLHKRYDQAYSRNAIILDSDEPMLHGPGLLRRTSTKDSKSTISSHGSSINYSDHTRSDSVSTDRSMESEPSPNGRSTGGLPTASRPTISASISAPNCTLSEYQPPLPGAIVERGGSKGNGKTKPGDQIRYQHLDPNRQDPTSSKKSFSMLQNFTQTASQKFKTLIRSQNGQRRRINTEDCSATMSHPIIVDDEVNERVVE